MGNQLRYRAFVSDSDNRRFSTIARWVLLATLIHAPVDLAYAQKPVTLPRIGILRPGMPPDPLVDRLLQGLRDLGYVDGKTVIIEPRFAEGQRERYPGLAAELVRLKVDVIYTSGVVSALRRATQTIPIVFMGTSDPVATGVVASLARPGGNVTGVTMMASDLWPKRLELLKEMFPKLSRVAMVWNKGEAGMALEAKATREAAGPMGVMLQDRGVNDANELEAIFAAMIKDRPDGFLPLIDPLLAANQKRILDFLEEQRLPAMFENSDWVEAGGLVSYGPNLADAIRRTAALIDKILKGTKPADIPVEQPMRFEFVINLKTAKQIGLTIPPNVLARADKIIK
jgi:putative ABC transport system substrate-binding protein